ncbi:hypothetical protein LJC68_03495 [Bacteroidales bacterium OttesenSCG-928-B11]|nr:hypothetical protein [Bacteroidales bacterium OttesenSCG-928-B11]
MKIENKDGQPIKNMDDWGNGILQADIPISFIIVFKTNSYDKIKGAGNYRIYCQFVKM